MEKKNDILRRPLYLYSLPAEVLDTLTYTDAANSAASDTQPSPAPPSAADGSEGSEGPEGPEESVGGPACALCGLSFTTAVDQRGHVKSDLHHYNLKQKMRGAASVTEAEFERLVGSLDESLSGSDWSGSESESDDGSGRGGKPKSSTDSEGNVLAALLKKQAVLAEKQRGATNAEGEVGDDSGLPVKKGGRERNSAAATAASSMQPLVWFRSPVLPENTYFGAYRALFTPEELAARPPEEALPAAIRSRQLAPIGGAAGPGGNAASEAAAYSGRHVFLCMIGGGHFAAMVVALAPRKVRTGSVPMNREATVLAHKTFHRYTTRRKQGGSQSANDNAKGAAHSAGSSLRRYNEQALVEDVRALLLEWKALLDSAELLLVRASGTTNRRTLFGPYDGQVLQAHDPRLRSFPFNTRRPTQNEMMRAFIELTRLKVREIVPAAVVEAAGGGGGDNTNKAKTKTKTKKLAARSEIEETALLHTAQLQALTRRSKVPALLAYLQANGLSAADLRFAPADAAQNHHAPTLLHLAAAQNAPALVTALLVRAGADPAVRNGDGRTPFELAGDRATRDAFRVARSELGEDGAVPAAVWESAHVPAPLTRAEAEQRDVREKQEDARREAERRRAEEARLKAESAAAAAEAAVVGGAGAKKKLVVTASVAKSAQEIREAEARGLTPEQRQRLERERRARAAEARMQRVQQGG